MTLPGLTAVVERPPNPPEPLRTDIAAFAGRTRRGPVGVATAVAGWREFQARFGGLAADTVTPYAVRAYFDNGGEVGWVVRLAGIGTTTAGQRWEIGAITDDGRWADDAPARAGFPVNAYRVTATSPGTWANGTEVLIEVRVIGIAGAPEVDVRITAPGHEPEYYDRLDPGRLVEALARSRFVRLAVDGEAMTPLATGTMGPQAASWRIVLTGGTDDAPSVAEYLTAASTIADLDEPALVAVPDLGTDLLSSADRDEVVERLAADAARTLDRLVILDVPPNRSAPELAARWADDTRRRLGDPERWRAVATYHPPLRVLDPLGGTADPLRTIPPSGPVVGVISRLDRERGAQHTPANAIVYDAVDVEDLLDEPAQAQLYRARVNNLRCTPGRGIEVWGGRTLDDDPLGTFIAHRRLVHRLVRAIRRVTEPLVFDTNGPELWLTIVRAVTTVLLEAFRSGGLKGLTPDEAFRVQCDDELNPPEERDAGRVLCLISVAPATPMEFIVLRLSFGVQGALEVVEQ